MEVLPAYRKVVAASREDRPDLSVVVDGWRRTADSEATLTHERVLPPAAGLDYYARWLARRVQRGQDAIVVVTGERGVGKSSLVLRLGKRVCRYLRRPWSTSEAILYSPERLLSFYLEAIDAGKRGAVGWIDEGGRVLYNRDFGTAESKAIVKVLTQIRETGAVLFVCIPSLAQLDFAVRTDLACLWLACRRRGLARVQLRDKRLRYEAESTFGFATAPRVPYLTWRPFDPESATWVEYLGLKRKALREGVVDAAAVVARASAARSGAPSGEALERRRRLGRERNRRYYKRRHPDAVERPAARREHARPSDARPTNERL